MDDQYTREYYHYARISSCSTVESVFSYLAKNHDLTISHLASAFKRIINLQRLEKRREAFRKDFTTENSNQSKEQDDENDDENVDNELSSKTSNLNKSIWYSPAFLTLIEEITDKAFELNSDGVISVLKGTSQTLDKNVMKMRSNKGRNYRMYTDIGRHFILSSYFPSIGVTYRYFLELLREGEGEMEGGVRVGGYAEVKVKGGREGERDGEEERRGKEWGGKERGGGLCLLRRTS